jgi:tetratricopeptide (TPR) repeat protein
VGDEPIAGSGYRLLGFLGRGGFGEVWKASAPGGAEVAVKVLNLAGVQGRKEFRALQLVKRIRHPNLVPLIAYWLKGADGSILDDAVTSQPDFFRETAKIDQAVRATTAAPPAPEIEQSQPSELIIIMGLGDESLFDRLQKCQQQGADGIPRLELLHYMEDAARAIDYLNSPIHDLGSGPAAIQHCDIKPHNIMIVGDATQVCDFGLAQMIGTDRTTNAAATLAYAAPECLKEGKPSRSTDQYSLAVSYFELQTGSLPYAEETHVAVMNAKLEGNLDFGRVTEAEQSVLRQATSSDPAKRYPTALEMVKSLRRAVEGGGALQRSRRTQVAALMAMLVALATIAGLAGYSLWPRANEVANGPTIPVSDPKVDRKGPLGNGTDPVGKKAPPGKVDPLPNTVAEGLKLARELEQQGDLDGAIKAYTQVLTIDHRNAEAYYQRGGCYLEREASLSDLPGQYDWAVSDLEQARALDPKRSDDETFKALLALAYLARGTYYLDDGSYPKAISDFDQAESHTPNDGRISSRRGVARYNLGEMDDAIKDFVRAIQLDEQPSDYVWWGRVLVELNRLDDAIKAFQEACNRNPESAEAHFHLGLCHLDKADPGQAIAALDEAIRIAAEEAVDRGLLPDAYGARGSCRILLEDFEKAADDYAQAISLSDDDRPDFHESRAQCFEALGQSDPVRLEAANFDRTIATLLGLLEEDPGHLEARNAVAYYLATSTVDEIRNGPRAVRHAQRACELANWENPWYLDTLAAAYAEDGQFDKAVEWSQKAIDLADDQEMAEGYRESLELFKAGEALRRPYEPPWLEDDEQEDE